MVRPVIQPVRHSNLPSRPDLFDAVQPATPEMRFGPAEYGPSTCGCVPLAPLAPTSVASTDVSQSKPQGAELAPNGVDTQLPTRTTIQEPHLGRSLDLATPLPPYFTSTRSLRVEHDSPTRLARARPGRERRVHAPRKPSQEHLDSLWRVKRIRPWTADGTRQPRRFWRTSASSIRPIGAYLRRGAERSRPPSSRPAAPGVGSPALGRSRSRSPRRRAPRAPANTAPRVSLRSSPGALTPALRTH